MTNPIAPSRFGKDHWSMLAYVECCCVDGDLGVGRLDRQRVRGNAATHPLLAVNRPGASWRPEYGTRLAGFFEFADRRDPAAAASAGLQVLDHDDWDCLDDLAAAGYVEIVSLVNGAVRLTQLGSQVASVLRRHKATGGQFATFAVPTLQSA